MNIDIGKMEEKGSFFFFIYCDYIFSPILPSERKKKKKGLAHSL
jgi:hypothetical protein